MSTRRHPRTKTVAHSPQFVADSRFNGAVLTGNDGRAGYVKASGLAAANSKKQFHRDSHFHLGSVIKWLTSVFALSKYLGISAAGHQ
ncbi:hypothetical protein D7Y04_14200 [Corallococcus sp. AB038B]|nr:hypothetical protein D7Y04_14200 [Corallococcus sp. AB038B]